MVSYLWMPRKKKERASSLEVVPTGPSEIVPFDPLSRYDGTLDSLADVAKTQLETSSDARWRLIELMRGDSAMAKLIETADLLKKRTRSRSPSLDELAEKSGTTRSHVVGAIARALHENNFSYARIIQALAMPRVTQAVIEMANTPDGYNDRALFMRASGLLPTPGGARINVNTNVLAQAKADNNSDPDAPRRRLPKFEDGIREIATTIQEIE